MSLVIVYTEPVVNLNTQIIMYLGKLFIIYSSKAMIENVINLYSNCSYKRALEDIKHKTNKYEHKDYEFKRLKIFETIVKDEKHDDANNSTMDLDLQGHNI